MRCCDNNSHIFSYGLNDRSPHDMAYGKNNLTFNSVCVLLENLETLLKQYQTPGTKLTKQRFRMCQQERIQRWNEHYNTAVLRDSESALAALSLLFPDLRQDRVYSLKEHTLAGVLAKALGMGELGLRQLRNWRLTEDDLGLAFEKELRKRVTSRAFCVKF